MQLFTQVKGIFRFCSCSEFVSSLSYQCNHWCNWSPGFHRSCDPWWRTVWPCCSPQCVTGHCLFAWGGLRSQSWRLPSSSGTPPRAWPVSRPRPWSAGWCHCALWGHRSFSSPAKTLLPNTTMTHWGAVSLYDLLYCTYLTQIWRFISLCLLTEKLTCTWNYFFMCSVYYYFSFTTWKCTFQEASLGGWNAVSHIWQVFEQEASHWDSWVTAHCHNRLQGTGVHFQKRQDCAPSLPCHHLGESSETSFRETFLSLGHLNHNVHS